jgi:hypothetical protein
MVSPLPRAKRAKNPHAVEGGQTPGPANNHLPPPETSSEQKSVGFTNNPFAKVEVK